MTLEARKRRELERKLDSLTVEFAEWTALAVDKQPLEKHHTQIARITGQLGALAKVVRAGHRYFVRLRLFTAQKGRGSRLTALALRP